MKIDKTTYKDREKRQNGMTAYYSSRPDKILFFAEPYFLFFKSQRTDVTLPFAQQASQRYAKSQRAMPP